MNVKIPLLAAVLAIAAAPSGWAQTLAAPTLNIEPASGKPALMKLQGLSAVQDQGERPFLGVMLGSAADGGGVTLTDVVADSPAAKAGLQANDVVTAIGDRTCASEEELREAIAACKVGQKVKVTFLRDGEKRHTSAKLAAAPTSPELKSTGVGGGNKPVEVQVAPSAGLGGGSSQGGAFARSGGGGLGGGQRGYLGVQLAEGEGGVSVAQVVDGSPAQKFGLADGDKIVKFDGNDVGSVEDLVKAVQSHKPGDKVAIVYERDGATKKAKVTLGAPAGVASGGLEVTTKDDESPSVAAPPTASSARTARAARIARPAAPDGATPAFQRELEAMRADLEKMRAELQQLRQQNEKQRRTIESIRRALGNEQPTPEPKSIPQAMAFPQAFAQPTVMTLAGQSPEPQVLGLGTLSTLQLATPGTDTKPEPGKVMVFAAPTQATFATKVGDDSQRKSGNAAKIVLKMDGQEHAIELPIQVDSDDQKTHVIEIRIDSNGHAQVVHPTGVIGTILNDNGNKVVHGKTAHGSAQAGAMAGHGGSFTIVTESDDEGSKHPMVMRRGPMVMHGAMAAEGGCCPGCSCNTNQGHNEIHGQGMKQQLQLELPRMQPGMFRIEENGRMPRFGQRLAPGSQLPGRRVYRIESKDKKSNGDEDDDGDEEDEDEGGERGEHGSVANNYVMRCDGPCEIRFADGKIELNCGGSVVSIPGGGMPGMISENFARSNEDSEESAESDEGNESGDDCCEVNCEESDSDCCAEMSEECEGAACTADAEDCEDCQDSEDNESEIVSAEVELSDDAIGALKSLGYAMSGTDDGDEENENDAADDDDDDGGDNDAAVSGINWM